MENNVFTIDEALRFGWVKFKSAPWYFVGIAAIVGLCSYLPGMVASEIQSQSKSLAFLISAGGWVLQMGVNIGLIALVLKVIDGQKPAVSTLFERFDLFFRYVGGTIVFCLIVLGGLILLIIPGIVWQLKYMFFSYFMVDKNVSIKESLRLSAKATDGYKWKLLGLMFALGLANLVGMLALVVGLLVSIPVTVIAYAYVYRMLGARVQNPIPVAPEIAISPAPVPPVATPAN